MKEALDAKEPYSGIVLNYTKTGTPFWNEITIRPVQTNGHVEQYIGTIRDVTDKIRLEEANKKAEMDRVAAAATVQAERDVTAYVFHEFRSDLQVATNAVVFWNDGDDVSDELKRAARRSLAHCSGLVENIMDITKLKAGKMVLEHTPFVLADVCGKAREAAEHQFPNLADQRAAVPPDVCVVGSPRHLTQVLQNLMSNACKNTQDDGFVQLAVEMVTETPHACTMRFAVRDSGCGVKPEEQPRIFAPYTQVGVKQGTGMGLSLSQALVKQMGGTVHVVSPWREDGPGAEFSFVVTLAKAAPVGPVATTRAPPLPDAWKVLVADDNAVLRLCVVKMLKKINDRWTVDEAVSGEDVVKLASSNERCDDPRREHGAERSQGHGGDASPARQRRHRHHPRPHGERLRRAQRDGEERRPKPRVREAVLGHQGARHASACAVGEDRGERRRR